MFGVLFFVFVFLRQNEPESVFQIVRTFNRDQGRLEAGRDLSLLRALRCLRIMCLAGLPQENIQWRE